MNLYLLYHDGITSYDDRFMMIVVANNKKEAIQLALKFRFPSDYDQEPYEIYTDYLSSIDKSICKLNNIDFPRTSFRCEPSIEITKITNINVYYTSPQILIYGEV